MDAKIVRFKTNKRFFLVLNLLYCSQEYESQVIGHNMPQTATALASWVKAIQKALEKAGVDSQPLLKQAGLDVQALNDPDARYSLKNTATLWKLAVQATRDSCFGLKVASQVNQNTFHVLGHSLITSTTLKEMFLRIIRYFRIVTDIPELEFYGEGKKSLFRYSCSRRSST